ncbi:uncharacterized protein LOC129939502 [Eupeodes corollae]|uniref:uncharacterized protein LOC129939502 n=1 Tax=Eupeodes corollae TaxID=290404 RepID=UPI002490A502|nr:uncharacterized protein LOC129939502 [Eupeodes corollae]
MFIWAIFILSGLLSRPIVANDDVWLEPNAWEIHSPSLNTCPVCETIPNIDAENSITTMYYRGMVSHLFNRNTLKVNPKTGHLERTITLTLTTAQLKIIENSSDIRDFNTAVMAVLKGAKEPIKEQLTTSQTNNESSFGLRQICEFIFSIMVYVFKLFSNIIVHSSETRFVMVVCAVVMAIWFVHRRYNKNLIFLIIASLIIFGYIISYIDCNRKLEAESVIEFIKETEPDKPRFFSKLLGTFFDQSEKDKKINRIINQSKVKLPFCRPDEVAIMYFNNMFFSQLQVTVEKIIESMEKIRNTVPFPFNYMGMIALPFLFVSILPLLFQNIFNPSSWYKVLRDPKPNHCNTDEMGNNNAHHGDRLTGKNLEILLKVLKAKTEIEEKPQNSAVEDVKDLPQAIAPKLDDSSSAEETNTDGNKSVVRIEDVLEENEKSKKES